MYDKRGEILKNDLGIYGDKLERIKALPSGEGLLSYLAFGIMPGGFLTAVLSNDLFGAFGRADHWNKPMIGEYVSVIFNDIPAGAWGNKEIVESWGAQRRLEYLAKV